MKTLLPIFYLPPISWFSAYLEENTEIILEQYENFPKQTYRNRTSIYGANGKLLLIIPMLHSGKRTFKDIEISYSEDWRKIHWKSIKTAYQSSPYFEFYEDKLIKIYEKNEKYLLDFNLKALNLLFSIMKEEKAYILNTEYEVLPTALDKRNAFSAKTISEKTFQEYYQSFTDKYGFINDLSVIDLICNKGPESLSYIKNLKIE